MNNIPLGQYGENVAISFLKREGYRICEQNFRTKLGEIDIIARDGRTICFIEVKTRKTFISGSPFEAVSRPKQRKLIQVALIYVQNNGFEDEKLRFDVVAVDSTDKNTHIELIKDAFDASEVHYY